MTSKRNAFEERVKRLSETESPSPKTSEQEGPSGFRTLLYVSLVALGLILPSLAVILSLREVASGMETTQLASLEGSVPSVSAQDEDPGFLMGLIGRKLGLYDSRDKGPLPYLPDAPKGWVRITTLDARNPNILDDIRSNWPNDRSGKTRLEDNPGYKHLQHFLRIYHKPDVEGRILAQTRTRAIYLNPNGEFMSVRLQFISEKAALGTPLDQSSWIKSLSLREAKSAEAGEFVEHNRLSGYDIINLTKPAGKSLVRRPIGTSYETLNGLKISVPLTHRVILSVDGITKPVEIGKIIETIDQHALVKLLH